ncbi:hypothetical protein AVEN_231668-1, partial [Araneus ventricosus]
MRALNLQTTSQQETHRSYKCPLNDSYRHKAVHSPLFRTGIFGRRDGKTHREGESVVSLRNLISAPTRQQRELATSIPVSFQTVHQGRRHVCCVRCRSSQEQ